MRKELTLAALMAITLIFFGSNYSFANVFGPKECPEGKGVVEVINNDKKLWIAVLISNGDGLKSERYLPKRSDGLTFLSSENFLIPPGKKISNCLPYDRYFLHIEFYRINVFLIGQWLEKVEEGFIFISPSFTGFSTEERNPSLREYLSIYGYVISTCLIIFSVILLVIVLVLIRLKQTKK